MLQEDTLNIDQDSNRKGEKLLYVSCNLVVLGPTDLFSFPDFQCWSDNMGKKGTPKLTAFDGTDFTEITFSPDLAKFKMSCLDRDTMALLTRRAYDIAGCLRGVKVYLNGKKLPVSITITSLQLKLIICMWKVKCDEIMKVKVTRSGWETTLHVVAAISRDPCTLPVCSSVMIHEYPVRSRLVC